MIYTKRGKNIYKNRQIKTRKIRKGGDITSMSPADLNFTRITNKISPGLFLGEMTQTQNEKLTEISEKFITPESNKLKSKPIYSKDFGKYDNEDKKDLQFIKNSAYEILSKLGFFVDESRCMIEFWSYYANGKKVSTTLDLHEDDYGVLYGLVDTVIFYTRKDETLEGGNLKILENQKKYEILFGMGKFHTTKEKTVEIKTNNIIAFNGNLKHQPEDVSGDGIRNCIVVQFKSKRDTFEYF
jgi:hypothetical protein